MTSEQPDEVATTGPAGRFQPVAWLAAISMLGLMAITLIDVILRKVTGRGLSGAIEYSELALVVCVFLGLGFAQARGAHVSTSVLTSRLKAKARRLVIIVPGVLGLAMVTVMSWQSVVSARHSIANGEYRFGMVSVPVWPARVAIVVGLLLFLFQYAKTLKREVGSDD